jgi:hypothetical protein
MAWLLRSKIKKEIKIMTKTHIPIKFKQIAKDNFPSIPEGSLILPLIAVSGSKQVVSLTVIKAGLDWLENYGETMELKEGVTPGKGLKRLKACLERAIEQAEKPKMTTPKLTKKKQ